MKWITVKEFAQKHSLSTISVYKRIKRGTIQTKKIKGITHVPYDAEVNIVQEQPNKDLSEDEVKQNEEWNKLQNEQKQIKLALQRQKLKNLKQDTELKKQKNKQVKQLYRRQFSEQVFESFTDSFTQLKNFFIELKLDKQQNEKLKNVFKKNIEKFRKNLNEKLKRKQIQDDAEDEVE